MRQYVGEIVLFVSKWEFFYFFNWDSTKK